MAFLNQSVNSELIAVALIGSVGVSFVGIHISHFVLAGDEQFALSNTIISVIATIYGTNFYCADLSDASFIGASLKNSNFSNANIRGVCWKNISGIKYLRAKNTYLDNIKLHSALVTGKGNEEDFSYVDMSGINLKDANLCRSILVGTDLNYAKLQGANLTGAVLKQTRLDGADLTQSCLTGAYIEDWGITAETKLDNVDCKYVFMRLPTQENPDPHRKPDNRQEEFQPSDFADFIRPIVETLDLYHNGTVDPRAIAISFKQLAENNPDANLEIVAMERRGNSKLLIRAKTAEDANLSQLNAEYFSTYNYFIALPPQAQARLLAEKDNRIQSLEAMVTTALQRPSFYTENNIHKVNTMHNNPGGISQSVSGGNIHGGLQASQGDNNQIAMKTSVASSSEEKQLTQSEVIQLLTQIEAMIHQAELPTDVKEESALYLGAAKKATEKEEPKKALAAENLKSMAETVQTASKTVESSKSLWENMKPLLIQLPAWLGVAQGFFGF